MAKNLKLNIKNTQIAQAINLSSIKDKLAKNKEEAEENKKPLATPKAVKTASEEAKEEQPVRIKARSKSAFSEPQNLENKVKAVLPETTESEGVEKAGEEELESESMKIRHAGKVKTSEELRKEIFAEEIKEQREAKATPAIFLNDIVETPKIVEEKPLPVVEKVIEVEKPPVKPEVKAPREEPIFTPMNEHVFQKKQPVAPPTFAPPKDRLGPTGRHVKDLYQPKPQPPKPIAAPTDRHPSAKGPAKPNEERPKPKAKEGAPAPKTDESADAKKGLKTAKFKEFKDVKPARKQEAQRFDGRDRQGLRVSDDDQVWRKKRKQHRYVEEDTTIRPTSLKVRLPITIKDLASEMKLKASQLIGKLFLQGIVATLNDVLDEETSIQLMGHEFGCEISIDTTEEERIRITDKSIKEEIEASDSEDWLIRPPVVAFMGHVDHGKTSLIDAIRSSNRVAGEAGAITQHIGAFRCSTPVGDIAILDTPGHEAFSAMRARGADVTDIIVLVIAGDEGIKPQTVEAMNHAKSAQVTIVVAINKCDKPNFNAENVYRQLSENELLPEAWGGQTITVNCSAATGEGIPQLLEMLALQAEVLELKANPKMRARGSVIESEMHKGMGAVATVLVQNGTLRLGDALVFDTYWGRVKTMRDEFNKELVEASPSTPVEVTGLSGLPEAGQEFIVVKNEREAREIAEARQVGVRQFNLQQTKKLSMENIFQQASESPKKVLNVILRADVQGSLEALKVAIEKIKSTKADVNIIFSGVGEVSESDVQLAGASKAVILGFHTQIESHAENLFKQLGVQVYIHEIIYHAIDNVKELMLGLLDKIAIETDKGKAEVRAIFKSSQVGDIAGCQVIEGAIQRNNMARVRRGKEVVWKGSISSLKRVKEDVREVQKGLECGIVLNGCNDVQIGDIIEGYEVTYIMQEL